MATVDRSDGRKNWRAIYYDANGKRRFRTTHTRNKRTAQAVADRLERQAQNPGAATAPNTTTLSDALEALIDHMEEEVKAERRAAGTLDFHREKAGSLKLDLEAGGSKPLLLSELGAKHCDTFISKRRGDGAAESTIAKELVTFRMALKLAKRRGEWSGQIDAIVPIRFAPAYVPRERFLTPDELVAVLACITPDHAARVAFAVATSANRSEAFRARREDVTEASVFVRGTKRATRLRAVPIVTPWQRHLIAFALEHAKGEGGKLFAFDGGFHNALQRACEDAGAPPACGNDLRRTFCHWMRMSGIPRDLVAAAMGHGSTAMVDKVYGKLTTSELSELMARAIGGTPVAQTHAHSADSADPADTTTPAKSAKLVPEEGIEPTRDFSQRILSPFWELPNPREYKRNRSYTPGRGTPVAQQPSSAEAISTPTRRRA